jgi:AraC family transcriptional regulator
MGLRSETRADHAARLDRVLEYLAQHLDEDLSLDSLAAIACLSPCHFHRIYRAVLGETLAETVRRLRLHRAAIDLLEGQIPVERIATRAGYTSQAAFTRAFRESYSAPPATYRAKANASLGGPFPIERRLSTKIEVLALAHNGDYDEIGGSFSRLFTYAASQRLLNDQTRSFGLYYNDPVITPPAELRSHACLSLSGPFQPENPFEILSIPEGPYMTLTFRGPYAELPRAYDWLYRDWLLESGETPANQPCVEEYLNDPQSTPAADLVTEIWLPLET